MEFADWVVSGLEQLRAGQLPGGQGLYQAVASGLPDTTALDAFMNGGDDTARAALVQAIAQAVAVNPAFEQQLRQAAASSQSAQGVQSPGYGAAGKPPFLKTTNGILVAVAAGVIVIGGGVGLGLGLSGGGSLGGALKGTWNCTTVAHSADEGDQPGAGTLTVGDSTWKVTGKDGQGPGGTWKQDGGKVMLTEDDEPGVTATINGVPTGTGSVDTQLSSDQSSRFAVHLKGSISSSTIDLVAAQGTDTIKISCKK
ncbi:hypothetical protein GCM10009839_50900 [Catenulispora yoronensis]|uniref:Uncharacterized protein n=1 Tax=Catenulispora yoronensis TaxID=450799 RepID=A0ABP5G8X8_9ACTN